MTKDDPDLGIPYWLQAIEKCTPPQSKNTAAILVGTRSDQFQTIDEISLMLQVRWLEKQQTMTVNVYFVTSNFSLLVRRSYLHCRFLAFRLTSSTLPF